MSIRGRYNKEHKVRDTSGLYINNLSSSVNKACDAWLEKKGLKSPSWKEQMKSKQKPK